jgi:hypothetical protein
MSEDTQLALLCEAPVTSEEDSPDPLLRNEVLRTLRVMVKDRQTRLQEARAVLEEAQRAHDQAQLEVKDLEESCTTLKLDYYKERRRQQDALPAPQMPPAQLATPRRSRPQRQTTDERGQPEYAKETSRGHPRTQSKRRRTMNTIRGSDGQRSLTGTELSLVVPGAVPVADMDDAAAVRDEGEGDDAALSALHQQDAGSSADAVRAGDENVSARRSSKPCPVSSCIDELETRYRIWGTEGEPGVNYDELFAKCRKGHTKAASVLVAGAEDHSMDLSNLAVYGCRVGGRVGMAFRRLMLFVQMQCTLCAGMACCTSTVYDNWMEPPDRVRFTVWSLTPYGQEILATLIPAFRNFPSILTRLMPQHTDMRVGLDEKATAEQRLRALFSFGCTLIDPTELSDEQLRALWNAILALCNARPGELDSAKRAVHACLEHIRGLGYMVDDRVQVTEQRVSRGWWWS